MTRALMLAVAIVFVGLGVAVAAGVTVADHLYDRAVADCATFGGAPAAVPDRLAYVCATPDGKVTP